jgi:hypothetical protein
MGIYDYSFNNNYILFQNPPPSNFSNFDYGASSSSLYHDYNPVTIPSYNHFTSTPSSNLFTTPLRHNNPPSPLDNHKIQIKNESPSAINESSSSIGKIQSIVHNTSEHVQELNQMCQIKDPKEFEKSISSSKSYIL